MVENEQIRIIPKFSFFVFSRSQSLHPCGYPISNLEKGLWLGYYNKVAGCMLGVRSGNKGKGSLIVLLQASAVQNWIQPWLDCRRGQSHACCVFQESVDQSLAIHLKFVNIISFDRIKKLVVSLHLNKESRGSFLVLSIWGSCFSVL